jgi:DNA-binding Xre family transcriptional regulator
LPTTSPCTGRITEQLENGKKNLQLSTLERVCEGLDVSMWEIIREAEAL